MTDKLPATPAELTPEMLNALLVGTLDGGTIVSVEAHDIGEGTGIFGQIARLDLTVEGHAGGAPTSVVAKMACTQPANLEIALMLGLYDREIKMFAQCPLDFIQPVRTANGEPYPAAMFSPTQPFS